MLGIAQTLVILTAGIDLSVGAIMILCSVVMGRTAVVYGVPVRIAFSAGLARRRLPAAPSTALIVTHAAAAALHRHARHLEHLRRAQRLVFAQRDHPRSRTWKRRRRSCNGPARSSSLRLLRQDARASTGRSCKGWVLTYGSLLMLVLALHRLVRPQPHRLRPPRLCHRRRSGCGAALGHQHQPHADRGLRAGRPHLRHRGLGADRPHRRGQPAGRADRQPRIRSPPW